MASGDVVADGGEQRVMVTAAALVVVVMVKIMVVMRSVGNVVMKALVSVAEVSDCGSSSKRRKRSERSCVCE